MRTELQKAIESWGLENYCRFFRVRGFQLYLPSRPYVLLTPSKPGLRILSSETFTSRDKAFRLARTQICDYCTEGKKVLSPSLIKMEGTCPVMGLCWPEPGLKDVDGRTFHSAILLQGQKNTPEDVELFLKGANLRRQPRPIGSALKFF
jgi:hypothetical protein